MEAYPYVQDRINGWVYGLGGITLECPGAGVFRMLLCRIEVQFSQRILRNQGCRAL